MPQQPDPRNFIITARIGLQLKQKLELQAAKQGIPLSTHVANLLVRSAAK